MKNKFTTGLVVGILALTAVIGASLASAGDSNPTHYTVAEGDSWQSIATSHGVTVAALNLANDRTESSTGSPRVGRIIHVPEADAVPAPTTTAAPAPPTTLPAPTTVASPTTIAAPTTTRPAPTTSTTVSRAPTTTAPPNNPDELAFSESFETSAGFYDRFDFGYSGPDPQDWKGGNFLEWRSDHSATCQAPGAGTDRTIRVGGPTNGHVDSGDFDDLFYYCAPGDDPAKGHLMTSVNTISYNIAWFSPKQTFTGITTVCVDVNLTEEGGRKWWQILFLSPEEATRWRGDQNTGTLTNSRAGSGGFDLGYTSPDFQASTGPGPAENGIKFENGLVGVWNSTAEFHNGGARSGRATNDLNDEATRYKQCFTDLENGRIRVDATDPQGAYSFTTAGSIPDDERRVVIQDDNYDPPKANEGGNGGYSEDRLTWHWDNVQVYTG